MTEGHICPQCQQPLPTDAPEGLCPACVLQNLATSQPGEPTQILPKGSKPEPVIDIADPAEVAKRLPQFEIIELLGRGGMGVVYKARQVQLDRVVALKILPPEDALLPDFVARFMREARSLAKLNHSNIVAVYDFGEGGGLYYLLMEFVDGANLRQLMQSKKLTADEALSIVPKVCDALEYAHEEGVVHRDIKPENILVDKKGRVKIADFGLAKLLRREALDMTLTLAGTTLGTLRYMAPEQMDKPESVDHRADIYSLGVVFYEMLTGETPVGRFLLPSQKAQVDARLDGIVLHALERDVELRYQHASEVKTDVEKVTSKPESAAVAAPAGSQPPERKPWPVWIWWTLLILVTLPYFQIAELNRGEAMAGHGPKYFLGGMSGLLLIALGSFAILKLLELRLTKAGAASNAPFSQAWLGIIVAIFGACLIAVGPFPYVEWLHEKLQATPQKAANAAGATFELAGFSQDFVRHGFEFWQGKAIALVSALAGAFLLLTPRRPRWNVACSLLLMAAGVAIWELAGQPLDGPYQHNGYYVKPVVEMQAKTDPVFRQFRDDFNRHAEAEAARLNVTLDELFVVGKAFEKLPRNVLGVRDIYGGALCEYKRAYGPEVCACAGLVLMLMGVMRLRQTVRSSPASFDFLAGFFRLVEKWSSLLLLVPCLLSVLPVLGFSWEDNMAWVPLFNGKTWLGEWVKESRLSLPGVEFWQGWVVAAVCVVALLVVFATALLGWKRGVRAAALGLAGVIAIACTLHFATGPMEQATISWDDFHAVAQRGAMAAASAETRKFLAEHPRYVGQIVEVESNLRTLIAKYNTPEPAPVPKVTVTKSADGKTTTTTTEIPIPVFSEAERKDKAKILEQGSGGVVSLYTSSRNGAQWPVLFGLGLIVLGIRDGWRAWKGRQEDGTASAARELEPGIAKPAGERRSRIGAWMITACGIGLIGCAWPGSIVSHVFFGVHRNLSEMDNLGIYVSSLFGDSPAFRAGIRSTDWIRSFAGREVHLISVDSPDEIWRVTPVGTDVEIKLKRGDKEVVLHTVRSPDSVVARLYEWWKILAGLPLAFFILFAWIGPSFPRVIRWRGVVAAVLGLGLLVLIFFSDQYVLVQPAKVLFGEVTLGSDYEYFDFWQKLLVCSGAFGLLLAGVLDLRRFSRREASPAAA